MLFTTTWNELALDLEAEATVEQVLIKELMSVIILVLRPWSLMVREALFDNDWKLEALLFNSSSMSLTRLVAADASV